MSKRIPDFPQAANPVQDSDLLLGVQADTTVKMTVGQVRGRLRPTAPVIYYVRADGEDTNNGLSNTTGGAFLTVQKAVDVVQRTYDYGALSAGAVAIIQIDAGSYPEDVSLGPLTGLNQGCVVQLVGSSPGAVTVRSISAHGSTARWEVTDVLESNVSNTPLTAVYDGAYLNGSKTVRVITADYTLTLADAGQLVYHPSSDAAAWTVTIPDNSSVPFEVGTTITIDNDLGGSLTITTVTDTLLQVGTALTGQRVLAPSGRANLVKVAATRWRIDGVGLS